MSNESPNLAAAALNRVTNEDVLIQRATDRRAIAVNDLARQVTNLLEQVAVKDKRLEVLEGANRSPLVNAVIAAQTKDLQDLRASNAALRAEQKRLQDEVDTACAKAAEMERQANRATKLARDRADTIAACDNTIIALRNTTTELQLYIRSLQADLSQYIDAPEGEPDNRPDGLYIEREANVKGTLTGDCGTDMETLATDETQIRFTTGSAERMVIVPAGCVVTVERA